MALTVKTLVDKITRLRPAQRATLTPDVESAITETLKEVSRTSATAPWRTELEIIVSLTLGAADAFGLQAAALPTTILPETVMLLDEVTHTALTSALIQRPSIAEMLGAGIFSASVYGYYTVSEATIYTRKGTGSLAVTANALKARAVKLMVTLADVPLAMEDLVEQAVIHRMMTTAQAA